jgi:hypothetical protein
VNLGKRAGLTSVYKGGDGADALTPELRSDLLKVFEPDIQWVEKTLGRQFPDWRAF